MRDKMNRVRGDEKEMPDRGTSTGVTDTYGATLGEDAINRRGSVPADSDPIDRTKGVENIMKG